MDAAGATGLQKRLPILTYHSLDSSDSVISLRPDRFRQQMQSLQAAGWRALSLDQLLAGHVSGGWPARTFVLTFDDGFTSFADVALPVLMDCGFTAIVFAVAEWVGRTNRWPSQVPGVPAKPLLDGAQLRALAEVGVEIGAHSLCHAPLTSLPEAAARREIMDCRQVLEQYIGRPVRAFAYPYGEHSATLRTIVRAHYRAGFGTQLAFATAASDPAAFERIDMYYLRDMSAVEALDSGWLSALLLGRRLLRRFRRFARPLHSRKTAML